MFTISKVLKHMLWIVSVLDRSSTLCEEPISSELADVCSMTDIRVAVVLLTNPQIGAFHEH